MMLNNHYNTYLTSEEKCYSNDNLLGKIFFNGTELNACHMNCPLNLDHFDKYYKYTHSVTSFAIPFALSVLCVNTNDKNNKLMAHVYFVTTSIAVFLYEHFFVVKEPDCRRFNNLYAKNLVHKTAPLELKSDFKNAEDACYFRMEGEAKQFHRGGMKSHIFNEDQTRAVMLNKEFCIKKHGLLNEECEKYYGQESVIEKKDYVPEFCYDANYFPRQYAKRDIKWDFVEQGKARYDLPEYRAEEVISLSYYEQLMQFMGFANHSHDNAPKIEL